MEYRKISGKALSVFMTIVLIAGLSPVSAYASNTRSESESTRLAASSTVIQSGMQPQLHAQSIVSDKSVALYYDSSSSSAKKLTAKGLKAKKAKWKSSKPRVVSVTKKGIAKAKKKGKATVTARVGKKTYRFNISSSKVSIDKSNAQIAIGQALKLGLRGDAIGSALSSNSTVASVSSTGTVIGLNAGNATITLVGKNSKKYTCSIVVPPILATGVRIDQSIASVKVGESTTLKAFVSPSNATDQSIRWSSNNPSVADVYDGVVIARSAGVATIMAITSNGKVATCTVTVAASASDSATDSQPTPDPTPTPTSDSEPVAVIGVSFEKASLELVAGGAAETNAATVSPTNATNKAVRYSSSNDAVATVDALGVVTPRTVGTATIIAVTEDGGKTATCTVTVKEPVIHVESVSFEQKQITLDEQGTSSLPVTVLPENATNKGVSYSTSDKAIATVDQNGGIRAVSPGIVYITATSDDGAKTGTCLVIVKKPVVNVASVAFENDSLKLVEDGESFNNPAYVIPTEATNSKVLYTSADDEIASVDEIGKVTPHRAGSTTIIATSEDGGKVNVCKVVVEAARIPVESVSFKNKSMALILGGDSASNPATVLPANATDSGIRYTSSDNNIVSVDADGVVTPLSEGSATLIATTTDGGKTATCNVVVKKPIEEAPALNLSVSTDEVQLGDMATLKCDVAGATTNDYKLAWRSSSDGGKTWDSCSNEGSETDTLSVMATESCLDMQYQCALTAANGVVTLSEPALIKVSDLVANVSTSRVRIGETAEINCTLLGTLTGNERYIWQSSEDGMIWNDIAGETSLNLSVKTTVENVNRLYRCVVMTNNEYSAFSESITLDVDTSVPDIQYQAHVREIGWQASVKNGAIAGTTGRGLRLEALKIRLNGSDGSSAISYRAHVQDIGWQGWVASGSTSGTTGKSLQMEAIQIKLSDNYSSLYDVYYRVHVADIGWLGWAKNSETAGSVGMCKQLEAIQICLVNKNEAFETGGMHELVEPKLTYSAHVENKGWLGKVNAGETAGTTGESLRLEALKVNLVDFDGSNGVMCRAHVADVGWQDAYSSSGEASGTVGQGKRMECVVIQLAGSISTIYDIYYRVHVSDIGWLGWAKNNEWAGTTGGARQMEAIQIKLVLKGATFAGYDANVASYRDLTPHDEPVHVDHGASVSLDVPYFMQTDSRWSGRKIGSKTIGQVGCLITSLAMFHSYLNGSNTYPGEMRNMLSFSGNSIIWSSVTNLGYELSSQYNTSINQGIMSFIYSRLHDHGQPVILGGASGSKTHWIIITGYTGVSSSSFSPSDFTINDPSSTSRTTLADFLSYRPTVLRLVY